MEFYYRMALRLAGADTYSHRLLQIRAMARKKISQPQQIRHTCGECKHGTYDWKFHNLSVDGKPTLVSCPFQIGRKLIVSEKACGYFELKQQAQ